MIFFHFNAIHPNAISPRVNCRRQPIAILFAITVFTAFACHEAITHAQEKIDFGRDVQPILADHCYVCHGPDVTTREAELRLDQHSAAVTQMQVIVPGEPDQSPLIARIISVDPDEQMPPADFKKPLTDAQKQILQQWIEEGAHFQRHWAFEPIDQPSLPATNSSPWTRGELDQFVLDQLNSRGITPAAEADRATLLRRVTQDLSGLPPTITELDAFLNDQSPNAYQTVVNRLLQSSNYAERMTSIWLDNARYADSNGYQFDNTRTMWPWRDWVIKAYATNMPFDQFVTEQLAGDLLPDATREQKIATGFNRNHGFTIEGGVSNEEYRTMYANDKTTTAATLFLGLTFECCRCHDHKYDPISIKEYYSLYAFFNSSAEGGIGQKGKPIAPAIEVNGGHVMVMQQKLRKSFVLTGGQFDQIGEEVQPDTPEALPAFGDRPRNRLGLANWLTSPENPLLARVTVNRVWQQLFGIGLVKTVDNFGIQGESPRHRALLDWLASDFRDHGWDMHHLIRTIVLSATYRQSSKHRPELEDAENRLLARGPSFRLPAEMIRDQALAVSGLLASQVGGPSVKPYQPAGIWEDLNAPASHAEIYKQDIGQSLYRKSMYSFWRRAALHPGMAVFDAPSRDVCSVLRSTTNTPLQALTLLHAPTYVEASRKLAELVLRGDLPEAGTNQVSNPIQLYDTSNIIQGIQIKDVSSEYSQSFLASNVLDGKGLQREKHGAISDNIAWLNAGIQDSHSQGLGAQITFDLGKNYNVSAFRVWNYNESRLNDLSRRGAKKVEVLISQTPDGKSFESVGTLTLKKASGKKDDSGKTYDLLKAGISIENARLIRFNIKTNHEGDEELIGLSEIQFIQVPQVVLEKTKSSTVPQSTSISEAIAMAMRLTVSRIPTARELKLLNNLYRERLTHYQAKPDGATTLLSVGESQADPQLDPLKLSAMADVCLAILNLSETITRK